MHSQELQKILDRRKEAGRPVTMARQITVDRIDKDGGGGFAIDVYDQDMYECETALYTSEDEFREDYLEVIKPLNRISMKAEQVRAEVRLKKIDILLNPHYMLVIKFEDETEEWSGSCLTTKKDDKGFTKLMEVFMEKYPNSRISLDRVTERNIELPRNYWNL